MVVLRRRQVACLRMIMIGTAVAGSLLFIYHYVDKPGYEDEIDRAVKELREETRKREHT